MYSLWMRIGLPGQRPEILADAGAEINSFAGSTLVAIGALLGVKTVGRDAEHVIALNTDAMDHARGVARGFIFRGVRRRGGMLAHKGNLSTREQAWPLKNALGSGSRTKNSN